VAVALVVALLFAFAHPGGRVTERTNPAGRAIRRLKPVIVTLSRECR
jgi:hypothetical protein